MPPKKLIQLKSELRQAVNPEKAAFFPRFFKAGPGEYAEGDRFLGVTVPQQRAIAKQFKDLPLEQIEQLILSRWHEERLTGLFILVGQYQKADEMNKKLIYDFYMAHTTQINNWDLVDSSAEYIVGPWLENRPEKMKILMKLAGSSLLWNRRIAMLATFHYIKQGRADEALMIADQLLHDPHDLIQKAVGWMLREIGKRADQALLIDFLEHHAATMPRTSLRYAIEHFTPERRQYFLSLASKAS
jgi:3-methyladenine DNA glycosylase AlkD